MAVALVLLCCPILSCKKYNKIEEIPSNQAINEQVFLIVERVVSGQTLNTSLTEPFGLAESRDGYIFVVDRGNNKVIRLSPELVSEKQIGGFGIGAESFNRPTFVTIDNGLNIYISDENNRRVARYDARLNFVDEIAFKDEEDPFKFGYPSGVGVTSYGEVWVADRDKNRICLFNNVGRFNRFIGEFGSTEGQMQNPEKIVAEQG
ncbi:MAG: NHL repeat-containing protein, partial [Candidatus Zixiibacteriota bacterium]